MKKPKDKKLSFEELAREVGADETGEEFDRAFGKLVPPKTPKPKEEKKPGK